jgi:hypothetical protein
MVIKIKQFWGKTFLIIGFFIAFFVIVVYSCEDQSIFRAAALSAATWTGATNSDWYVSTNWDTGQVPTDQDNVVIDSASVDLAIPSSTNYTINSLTLIGSATLTIAQVNTGSLQTYDDGMTWEPIHSADIIATKLIIAQDLILSDTAILTHPANADSMTTPYTLNLEVGRNVTVSANAKIDVAGKGFASDTGPGKQSGPCESALYSRGGGSYGGTAIEGGNCHSGSTYGSAKRPIDLGSGGRCTIVRCNDASGGGAIKLSVGDTLKIDGSIIANGAGGDIRDNIGGSGGSIWLAAQTITGSGSIIANGGIDSISSGGAGGGGRVALYFQTNTLASVPTADGYCSAQDLGMSGAGTVYFFNTTTSIYGDLLISNPQSAPANIFTTPIPQDIFDQITIAGTVIAISERLPDPIIDSVEYSSYDPSAGYGVTLKGRNFTAYTAITNVTSTTFVDSETILVVLPTLPVTITYTNNICISFRVTIIDSASCYYVDAINEYTYNPPAIMVPDFTYDISRPNLALSVTSIDLNLNAATLYDSVPVTAVTICAHPMGCALTISASNPNLTRTLPTFYELPSIQSSGPLAENTWGYSVDNQTFLPIPTTPADVIDRTNVAAFGRQTVLYYGTKISPTFPAGAYSTKIVYTLIANGP